MPIPKNLPPHRIRANGVPGRAGQKVVKGHETPPAHFNAKKMVERAREVLTGDHNE